MSGMFSFLEYTEIRRRLHIPETSPPALEPFPTISNPRDGGQTLNHFGVIHFTAFPALKPLTSPLMACDHRTLILYNMVWDKAFKRKKLWTLEGVF